MKPLALDFVPQTPYYTDVRSRLSGYLVCHMPVISLVDNWPIISPIHECTP
jgi:hypothetical protein